MNKTKISIGSALFLLLTVMALGWAICLRFAMPASVFIDGDICGYLNPALDFLKSHKLAPSYGRGLYYPLFILPFIWISGNINFVAYAQHAFGMLGLILMAISFYRTDNSGSVTLRRLIVLLAIIFVGWDSEVINLEHTIRPEGMSIFFAGTVFYFLQKLISKPSFKIYAVLVAVSALMLLMQVKFILAGLFVISCATVIFLKGQGNIKPYRNVILFLGTGLFFYTLCMLLLEMVKMQAPIFWLAIFSMLTAGSYITHNVWKYGLKQTKKKLSVKLLRHQIPA